MAKIGLRGPVYKGTTSGTLGKAVKADISIEMNDVQLYADDAIAESHKSFKKGAITLDTSDMDKTAKNILLGHTLSGNEITSNKDDSYPYVGFGFYGVEQVSGSVSYRAIWLPNVQFSEPADNNATKGDSFAFGTHSLPGTILTDENGDWKKEESFSLEADAVAYLNTKADLPVSESTGISALLLTGIGGTLLPAFGSSVRAYTYGGITGASITVKVTAASHTIKLYEVADGVDTLLESLVSGTASNAITMAIGSKILKIVAYEANKTSQITYITAVKVS